MNSKLYPNGKSNPLGGIKLTSVGRKPAKDEMLMMRALGGMNVAQFVSFNPITEKCPSLTSRFSAIAGKLSSDPVNPKETIHRVLDNSGDGTVNIRSFTNERHQGNPFIVGLSDVDDILVQVEDLARRGYTTIVHETINVNDGGLNCVYAHGHVECLTGATPRGVENCDETVAVFNYKDFIKFVHTVYGPSYLPDRIAAFLGAIDKRVEFSLHPKRRGVRNSHLIIWEESTGSEHIDSEKEQLLQERSHQWPNSVSRLIGDKVFGLLEAEAALRSSPPFAKNMESFTLRIGVPKTTVFLKHPEAPIFQFGTPTGSGKVWTRTCPKVQLPGKYPTWPYWVDPMSVLYTDESRENELASCIIQEGVDAKISGAAMVLKTGELKIEGTTGFGDRFMEGRDSPSFEYLLSTPNDYKEPGKVRCADSSEVIEKKILRDLCAAWGIFRIYFGCGKNGIRFEWAHDGQCLWILQLHVEQPQSLARVIFEGEPKNGWLTFKAGQTLDDLRKLVITAKEEEKGICIKAKIGITSHIADVCRKAKIPTIIDNM